MKRRTYDVTSSRKGALPAEFTRAYLDYIGRYDISGQLFPFTDRFALMLFAELADDLGRVRPSEPRLSITARRGDQQ